MAYTATGDIGTVRALIHDLVVDGVAHFDDDTLQIYLDLESGDVRMAAADALDAWAAKLAEEAHDVSIGDYRENLTGRARAMGERAAALRAAAENTPALGFVRVPADIFSAVDIATADALNGVS